MTHRVELPDKLYFKIGEVAKLADVKPHVLRYWESEFSAIRPQKSKSNQRLYRRSDVEAVLAIKHLLYDRKFTTEGAKRYLREEGKEAALPALDAETVVAEARREAFKEMEEAVAHVKSDSKVRSEKMLLELKQCCVEFRSELDGFDNARRAK